MGTGKKFIKLGCNPQNVVGYCHYHKATMSAEQVKKKKCLEKQCNRLQRTPNLFWDRRDEINELRRKRKEERKQIWRKDHDAE